MEKFDQMRGDEFKSFGLALEYSTEMMYHREV